MFEATTVQTFSIQDRASLCKASETMGRAESSVHTELGIPCAGADSYTFPMLLRNRPVQTLPVPAAPWIVRAHYAKVLVASIYTPKRSYRK